MATSVIVSTEAQEEQIQSQWSTVFPTTNIVTEQQSILFVKKLVAVGISSITYLRVLFPEYAYADHFIESLNLKILIEESRCSAASTLISWVHGCFEAIEKNYLKQMTLAITDDAGKENNVLETYTFRFSYSNSGVANLDEFKTCLNGGQVKEQTFEIRKPTLKMLHTIILLTETLRPLPENIMISMKLQYYDITPIDYEPPGFQSSEFDDYDYTQEHVTFKVGDVATAFHRVKLRCKVKREMLENESIAEPVQKKKDIDSEVHCEHLSPDLESVAVTESIATVDNHRDIEEIGEVPLKRSSRIRKSVSSYNIFPPDSQNKSDPLGLCSSRSTDASLEPTEAPIKTEYPIRCPCHIDIDQGIMLFCSGCGFWQHGPCFSIIDEYNGPEEHFCNICAVHASMCTDPLIYAAAADVIQPTCIYRRALILIRDLEESITPSKISNILGVNFTIGSSLIDKMLSENILKQDTSKSSLVVDREVLLKMAFPKYLNKVVWPSPSIGNVTPMNNVGAGFVSPSKEISFRSTEMSADMEETFGESPLHGILYPIIKKCEKDETPYKSPPHLRELSIVIQNLDCCNQSALLNNSSDLTLKNGDENKSVVKRRRKSFKKSLPKKRIIGISLDDSETAANDIGKKCLSVVQQPNRRLRKASASIGCVGQK